MAASGKTHQSADGTVARPRLGSKSWRPTWMRSPMSGDSRIPRGKAVRRTSEEITASPRRGLYALSGRWLTAMPEVPRRSIPGRDFDNSGESLLVSRPATISRPAALSENPAWTRSPRPIFAARANVSWTATGGKTGLLGDHPSRRDLGLAMSPTAWITAIKWSGMPDLRRFSSLWGRMQNIPSPFGSGRSIDMGLVIGNEHEASASRRALEAVGPRWARIDASARHKNGLPVLPPDSARVYPSPLELHSGCRVPWATSDRRPPVPDDPAARSPPLAMTAKPSISSHRGSPPASGSPSGR